MISATYDMQFSSAMDAYRRDRSNGLDWTGLGLKVGGVRTGGRGKSSSRSKAWIDTFLFPSLCPLYVCTSCVRLRTTSEVRRREAEIRRHFLFLYKKIEKKKGDRDNLKQYTYGRSYPIR